MTNTPQYSPEVLEETPARATKFLLGVGALAIVRTQLAMAGMTAADLLEGRTLLLACLAQPERMSPELDSDDAQSTRAALAELDAWDEPNFARYGAALLRRFPSAHAYVFRDLKASTGSEAVAGVATFLARIEALAEGSDPARAESVGEDAKAVALLAKRGLYQSTCTGYTHLALEEPEAHLHPKVQTRLAHWMVALAMVNRRIIVETHSDHFVRRLRGLMARAAPGSELERWLRDNVSIVEVEQDAEGRSSIQASRLTADGMLDEHWPADFMDEASDEERAIYYASLDKAPAADPLSVEGVAFLDAKGNGWARPNINEGAGYHWDVYIANVSLMEEIGLSQLNIVEHGAPPKEGAPGSIHHTPGKKKSRLRDTGWSC